MTKITQISQWKVVFIILLNQCLFLCYQIFNGIAILVITYAWKLPFKDYALLQQLSNPCGSTSASLTSITPLHFHHHSERWASPGYAPSLQSLSDHTLETVFLKHNSKHVTPVLKTLQKSSFPTRQPYFNIQIKCFFLHTTLSNSLPLDRSYCFPLWTWQPLTSYYKCLYLHYIIYTYSLPTEGQAPQ